MDDFNTFMRSRKYEGEGLNWYRGHIKLSEKKVDELFRLYKKTIGKRLKKQK